MSLSAVHKHLIMRMGIGCTFSHCGQGRRGPVKAFQFLEGSADRLEGVCGLSHEGDVLGVGGRHGGQGGQDGWQERPFLSPPSLPPVGKRSCQAAVHKKRRRSSHLLKLDGVGGFLGIGALTLPFSLGAAAFWELEAGLVEGSFAFFVVAFFAAAH